MQIGLTDSATHVFFRYVIPEKYASGGFICAGEKFHIVDTETGKKYKMINSLNIPICPTKHIHVYTDVNHYFSLSFETLPKSVKKINIIENNASTSSFNFYGVSLIDNIDTSNDVDYIGLINETPVREYSYYIKEGKVVQYYIHNGYRIAMHLSVEKNYGNYYTAYISVENNNEKRVDFFPENIEAIATYKEKQKKIQVLSHAEFMKKVTQKQALSSFFIAYGETSLANNAGYSSSTTTTNKDTYTNKDGYASGYSENNSAYINSNVRSYSNSSSTSNKSTYNSTQNYYARQNANNNISNYNRQQLKVKESINQGYLKSNTLFEGQVVNGYINIKYELAEIIQIIVPVGEEKYTFYWTFKK